MSAPLSGQARARQFEFGAFGAYTRYDDAFNLNAVFGGGARFGYFVTSHLSLEVDVLFQSQQDIAGTSGRFEPLIGGPSVVFNLPVAGVSTLYLLGGYSRLDFGTTNPYRFTDGGVHGAAGVRLSFSERAALRVEGRAIYTPSTRGEAAFGTKSAQHFVVAAGFSVFHSDAPRTPPAQRAPTDSDSDGVTDKPDQCPGTPLGATVDARGCPLDGDKDGVYDGLDKCADTPAGAIVDGTGCHGDSDGDKVFDGLDRCPDTPAGATVDPNGCPSDGDGDRVYDGIDQCPDTPPGASVNALGCPADEDADKVPDGVDQCPGTPLGAVVDGRGCPMDSDGDKVYDGIDQCPNTAPGAVVDARGCTTEVVQAARPPSDTMPKDSDLDGVNDSVDRCPNTPRGSAVDQFGCIILFREEPGAKATALILQGVNFTTGRSVLTRQSYGILDAVAGSLVANPDVKIEIAGHTDNVGAETLNQRLSQARAAAVRHYLASKGVAPVRMTARGYGEAAPIADNTTPAGRAQNRRVELRRIE
jgi:outer membrane protein OmpA-like peptidoglycan-associated protein